MSGEIAKRQCAVGFRSGRHAEELGKSSCMTKIRYMTRQGMKRLGRTWIALLAIINGFIVQVVEEGRKKRGISRGKERCGR